MSRVLLVGQAPSASAEDLQGLSGARIARLCDVPYAEYLELFERRNLVQDWPGYAPGGGDAFPMGDARRGWARLLPALHGRKIVLLGRKVGCIALGHAPEWFRWERRDHWTSPRRRVTFEAACAPHPSGLSRWWNEPDGFLAASAWWQELVRGIRQSGDRPREP